MNVSVENIAFLFSIVAVVFSFYSYKNTRRDTLYQDLDGLYLEVLKLAMSNPRFVNPDLTRDYKKHFQGDELHKYQVFAYLAWNVCETIADRRKDKHLFDTWRPVIHAEDKLHGVWLDDPDNHYRFKKSFIDFVQNDLRKL